MQAITVRDRDAGVGGVSLTDMPYPRAAALVRAGGTLGTVVGPPKARPEGGRLKPIVGAMRTLQEAAAALTPDRRTRGKTIIQVTGG